MISPDGKWIAYYSYESGRSEVYVQPFPGPGAKTRISTQQGTHPRWSRDGRELFYLEVSRPSMRLMAVEAHTGPQGFQASAPAPLITQSMGSTWDVTPDGKRFLIEMGAASETEGHMNFVTNWFEDLRRRAPAKR